MRRFLLYALCLITLCLLLVILYSWARSYFPRNSRFETHDGALHMLFWEGSLPRPLSFQAYDPNHSDWMGVGNLWHMLKNSNPSSEFLSLGFGSVWGQYSGMSYHILAIPFWFLFILTITPLLLAFIALRRHHRRAVLGQCLQCGYDLRESKTNCPECGAAIACNPKIENSPIP